jgi:large subunit ribosomal protein L1
VGEKDPEVVGGESTPEQADATAAEAADATAAGGGEAVEAPREKKKRFPRKGFQRDGKRIRGAREKIDKSKLYPLNEALSLLTDAAPKRKFAETIELAMFLGVDPKKQGQMLRGSLSLPNGVGKTNRVIAFCEADIAESAKAAGAIEVGMDDLAKRITDGWDDFDVAVAHPSAMRVVGKLGRILGPKGKMPTPKAGTVTPDVATAVTEFAAGKIEYRTDQYGNVHVPVGKRDFEVDKLVENINAFVDHIVSIKPADAKGVYIKKVVVTSTMGPGIPVEVTRG